MDLLFHILIADDIEMLVKAKSDIYFLTPDFYFLLIDLNNSSDYYYVVPKYSIIMKINIGLFM